VLDLDPCILGRRHPCARAIESWIPLFLFVILLGVSMDYHMFVVSRIRAAHEAGLATARALSAGIRAGVVTSTAAIMVAVFAVFATLSMQDFKQLGVGPAIAILLDATLIRVVLLPSVITLLGERNWYLPRWLARLPGLSYPARPETPPARVGSPPVRLP
jgi:RND superfamily putative drug exporter